MSKIRILSASQVDTYRGCSLKWHYRYVDKLPEDVKSGALVVGSAVDVAVKSAIHQLRSGESSLSALKPTDLAREAWDGELASAGDRHINWGEKGKEAAWRAVSGLVEAFVALPDLQARIARIESVDLRFELAVDDPRSGIPVPGLFVQGILDFVEKGPDGRLRALDLKTAASRAGYAPEDLGHHLQGSLYTWALAKVHGASASDDMAFTIGLKLKESTWEDRLVTLAAAAQRRALLSVIHADRAMRLGVAFPQPSWLCGSCPYLGPCASWHDNAVEMPMDTFARGALSR